MFLTVFVKQAEVNEEEQSRTEAEEEEDELRKVFQTTVSLCVHNGLMTPGRGHRYYRSGEIHTVMYVCVCMVLMFV